MDRNWKIATAAFGLVMAREINTRRELKKRVRDLETHLVIVVDFIQKLDEAVIDSEFENIVSNYDE